MKNLTLDQAKAKYSKGYKETIQQWTEESNFIINRIDFQDEYENHFIEYVGFSEDDFFEWLKSLDSRIKVV